MLKAGLEKKGEIKTEIENKSEIEKKTECKSENENVNKIEINQIINI